MSEVPAVPAATGQEGGVRLLDPCIESSGWRNDDGYAYVRRGGRDVPAHRAAYEEAVGPIAHGLEIDHLCRNRACVNPDHLEPVSHAENQRRSSRAQTACRRAGHDWSNPRNVFTRPNGRRYCAECTRIDQRSRRHVAA